MGDFWTHPEAFRTGPPSCLVQGMISVNDRIDTHTIFLTENQGLLGIETRWWAKQYDIILQDM